MRTILVENFNPEGNIYTMGCKRCCTEWIKKNCIEGTVERTHKMCGRCPHCNAKVIGFESVSDVSEAIEKVRVPLETI